MAIATAAETFHHVELQNRFQKAQSIKTGYATAMEEIVAYGAPTLGNITTKMAEGAVRQKPVFDSTLMRARELLVNFLVGNIFPSSEMGWAQLDPPMELKENRQLKVALDKTSERLLAFLARSNFYEQAASHVDGMFTLGNAVMTVQEDTSLVSFTRRFGRLVYDTVPLHEIQWLAEAGNRIYFVARCQEMTLSEVSRKFPSNPGKYVTESLKNGKSPTEKVELRHYVYRNEFSNPSQYALKSPPAFKDMPWVEEYVIEGGGQNAHETIFHRGMEQNDYVISRLMVTDNDTMGRGLGHISRPDTKSTNFISRLTWLGIDRDIRRPMLVWDKTHMGLYRPGSRAVGKPGYPEPKFLDPGVDILRANEVRRQDQQSIMQIWGADAFVDPESQPRSAEESVQRRQRNLQRHAKNAQRVANGFLDPILQNTIWILEAQGELPELSEQAELLGESELPFRYTSPMFRSQMASQLELALALLERRAELTQITGQDHWFDDLDLDHIKTMERDFGGVPELAYKSQEDLELLRQARGERDAMQQQALLEATARSGSDANIPSAGGVPLG